MQNNENIQDTRNPEDTRKPIVYIILGMGFCDYIEYESKGKKEKIKELLNDFLEQYQTDVTYKYRCGETSTGLSTIVKRFFNMKPLTKKYHRVNLKVTRKNRPLNFLDTIVNSHIPITEPLRPYEGSITDRETYITQVTNEILHDLKIGNKVFVYGFSFGGANVAIIAEELHKMNIKNNISYEEFNRDNFLKMVTFGSIYIPEKKKFETIDLNNIMIIGDVAMKQNKKIKEPKEDRFNDIILLDTISNDKKEIKHVNCVKTGFYRESEKNIDWLLYPEYTEQNKKRGILFGNDTEWTLHNSYTPILRGLLHEKSNDINVILKKIDNADYVFDNANNVCDHVDHENINLIFDNLETKGKPCSTDDDDCSIVSEDNHAKSGGKKKLYKLHKKKSHKKKLHKLHKSYKIKSYKIKS